MLKVVPYIIVFVVSFGIRVLHDDEFLFCSILRWGQFVLIAALIMKQSICILLATKSNTTMTAPILKMYIAISVVCSMCVCSVISAKLVTGSCIDGNGNFVWAMFVAFAGMYSVKLLLEGVKIGKNEALPVIVKLGAVSRCAIILVMVPIINFLSKIVLGAGFASVLFYIMVILVFCVISYLEIDITRKKKVQI